MKDLVTKYEKVISVLRQIKVEQGPLIAVCTKILIVDEHKKLKTDDHYWLNDKPMLRLTYDVQINLDLFICWCLV